MARLLFAAAVLALAPPISADVLVVDRDGSGGDHLTIQSAVDAAASGDTILVRAPHIETARYAGFVVDGKSLTIRGEGRPLVLTGAVIVSHIGLGQTVVLDGLDLNRRTLPGTTLPVADVSGPGLTVLASLGAVRLVDCSFEGSFGNRMWAGLQLFSALDVTLHRCEVLGAESPSFEEVGGSAVQSISSRISIYDSHVVGGKGNTGGGSSAAYGSDGGTGLALFNRSVAWLASTEIEGGPGGGAECSIYVCDDFPGDGGTGLLVTPGSVCVESRSMITGGAGGETGFNSFTPGGSPGAASIGNYASDATTHVEFSLAAARVRSGGHARVTITGIPGESARVALARGGGFRFFGNSRGVLQVSDYLGGLAFTPLGVIPTSGSITADIPLPPETPDSSETYFLQAAIDTGPSPADFRLSGPVAVMVDGAAVPSTFDRTVARVDPNAAPGGDGRTWGTACVSLEEALARLPWSGGGEVWLRGGTYLSSEREGVLLGSNTRIFGGFAGTETAASEANPAAHPTLFEGDLAGNGSGPQSAADNCTSLFRIGSPELDMLATNVELRGVLTVHCVDVSDQRGAVTVYGDAIVEECRFLRHRTRAIRHLAGDLSVRRSSFVKNTAYRAGAIYSNVRAADGPAARLDVSSCVFNGNVGLVFGSGAVYADRVDAIRVVGSTLHANSLGSQPGGIVSRNVPSIWVTNCVLSENSGPASAGAITNQVSFAQPQSLVFQYNSAPILSLLYQVNGNVMGTPGFVDPLGANGIRGDEDDDLRLGAGSHAIDAGNSLYLRPWAVLDIEGRPRRLDDPAVPDTGVGGAPVVDMGAYER